MAAGQSVVVLEAMTLGKVELSDGAWATGFVVDPPSGTDLTAAGGRRAHLA